jgi:hypothetical protein
MRNGAPYIFIVTNFLAPALECEGRMLGTIIARARMTHDHWHKTRGVCGFESPLA